MGTRKLTTKRIIAFVLLFAMLIGLMPQDLAFATEQKPYASILPDTSKQYTLHDTIRTSKSWMKFDSRNKRLQVYYDVTRGDQGTRYVEDQIQFTQIMPADFRTKFLSNKNTYEDFFGEIVYMNNGVREEMSGPFQKKNRRLSDETLTTNDSVPGTKGYHNPPTLAGFNVTTSYKKDEKTTFEPWLLKKHAGMNVRPFYRANQQRGTVIVNYSLQNVQAFMQTYAGRLDNLFFESFYADKDGNPFKNGVAITDGTSLPRTEVDPTIAEDIFTDSYSIRGLAGLGSQRDVYSSIRNTHNDVLVTKMNPDGTIVFNSNTVVGGKSTFDNYMKTLRKGDMLTLRNTNFGAQQGDSRGLNKVKVKARMWFKDSMRNNPEEVFLTEKNHEKYYVLSDDENTVGSPISNIENVYKSRMEKRNPYNQDEILEIKGWSTKPIKGVVTPTELKNMPTLTNTNQWNENKNYKLSQNSPIDRSQKVYAIWGKKLDGIKIILHSNGGNGQLKQKVIEISEEKADKTAPLLSKIMDKKLTTPEAQRDVARVVNRESILPNAYTFDDPKIADQSQTDKPIFGIKSNNGRKYTFIGWSTKPNNDDEKVEELITNLAVVCKKTDNGQTHWYMNTVKTQVATTNVGQATGAKDITEIQPNDNGEVHLYAAWKPYYDIKVTKSWYNGTKGSGSVHDKFEKIVHGDNNTQDKPEKMASQGDISVGLIRRTAVTEAASPTVTPEANYYTVPDSLKELNKGQENLTWQVPGYDQSGKRMSYVAIEFSRKEANEKYKNFGQKWSNIWTDVFSNLDDKLGSGSSWTDKTITKIQSIALDDKGIDVYSGATIRKLSNEEKDTKNVKVANQGSYDINLYNIKVNIQPPELKEVYGNDNYFYFDKSPVSGKILRLKLPEVDGFVYMEQNPDKTWKRVEKTSNSTSTTAWNDSQQKNIKITFDDKDKLWKVEWLDKSGKPNKNLVFRTGQKIQATYIDKTNENTQSETAIKTVLERKFSPSLENMVQLKKQKGKIIIKANKPTSDLGQFTNAAKIYLVDEKGDKIYEDQQKTKPIMATNVGDKYVFEVPEGLLTNGQKVKSFNTDVNKIDKLSDTYLVIDKQAPTITLQSKDKTVYLNEFFKIPDAVTTDEPAALSLSSKPDFLHTDRPLEKINSTKSWLMYGTPSGNERNYSMTVKAEDEFGNESIDTFVLKVVDRPKSESLDTAKAKQIPKTETYNVLVQGKKDATLKLYLNENDTTPVAEVVCDESPKIINIPQGYSQSQIGQKVYVTQTEPDKKESDKTEVTMDLVPPEIPTASAETYTNTIKLTNIASDVKKIRVTAAGATKTVDVQSGQTSVDVVFDNKIFAPNDTYTVEVEDEYANAGNDSFTYTSGSSKYEELLKTVDLTVVQGAKIPWEKSVSFNDKKNENTGSEEDKTQAKEFNKRLETAKADFANDVAKIEDLDNRDSSLADGKSTEEKVGTIRVTFKDKSTIDLDEHKLTVTSNKISLSFDEMQNDGKNLPRNGDDNVKGQIKATNTSAKLENAVVTVKDSSGNTLGKSTADRDGKFYVGTNKKLKAGEDVTITVELDGYVNKTEVQQKVQLNPDKLVEILPTADKVYNEFKDKPSVNKSKLDSLKKEIDEANKLVANGKVANSVAITKEEQESLDTAYENIKKAIGDLTANNLPEIEGPSYKEFIKNDRIDLDMVVVDKKASSEQTVANGYVILKDADNTQDKIDLKVNDGKYYSYEVYKISGQEETLTDTATMSKNPGTYKVTYKTEDSAGKIATFTMTIKVKDDIIAITNGQLPNPIPNGYVSVVFKSGQNAGLQGTTMFLVKQNSGKSSVTEPTIIPYEGYKVDSNDKWTKEIPTTFAENFETTAKVFKKVMTDQPKGKDAEKYAKVTFQKGDHGEFEHNAVTTFWTLKNEQVSFNPPSVKANDNFVFAGWEPEVQQTYAEDKTHTAKYVSKSDVSEVAVKDFQEVKFKSGNDGNFGTAGNKLITEKSVWVRPGKTVDLSIYAPTVTVTAQGKCHIGWDKKLQDTFTKTQTPTEINAVYKDTVTKTKPTGEDAKYYAEVEFDAGVNGTIANGQTTKFWVVKGQKATITKPQVTAKEGWKVDENNPWSPKVAEIYNENTKHTANYTYTGNGQVAQKPGQEKPKVPENFVKVEFKAGTNGTIANTETTIYWVDPEKETTVTAPKVSAKENYKHTGWNKELTQKFASATEITATYKQIVVDSEPTENKDDYAKVEFDAGANGKFKETNTKTTFWVLKNEKAKINTPEITANENFVFASWEPEVKQTYAENTKHTAKYTSTLEISDKEVKGYKKVTFSAGTNGKFTETNAQKEFWIKPNTLVDLTAKAPKVTANEGYSSVGWDKKLVRKVVEDETITAKYLQTNVTTKPTGEDAKYYAEVEFDAGVNGTIANGQTTKFWVVKGQKATITKPQVTAKEGWKVDENNPWSPKVAEIYNENTKHTANYNHISGISNTPVEGWSEIIFNEGANGRLVKDQKNVLWVNPNVDVVLKDKAPSLTPDINYSFDKWLNSDSTDAKLEESKKYPSNATFTASYTSDIFVGKESDKPQDYVKITFVSGEHGKFDKDSQTEIFVKKNKEVDLNAKAPKVIADKGYGHSGWDTQLKATFTADTQITATYKQGEFKIADLKELIVLGPEKMAYTDGEKLDLTGLKLVAIDRVGLQKQYENFEDIKQAGFNVTLDDNTEVTDNLTLTFAHNDKKIVVKKNEVSASTITKLKVTKHLSVGPKDVIAANQKEKTTTTVKGTAPAGSSIIVRNAQGEQIGKLDSVPENGEFTLEVTKQDENAEIKVTSKEKDKEESQAVSVKVFTDKDGNWKKDADEKFNIENIKSVEITSQPSKMNYFVTTQDGKAKFNAEGLEVKAIDNNGNEKTYKLSEMNDSEFTIEPANGKELSLADDNTKVTVTLKKANKSATSKDAISVKLDSNGDGVADKDETFKDAKVETIRQGDTNVVISDIENGVNKITITDGKGKSKTVTKNDDGTWQDGNNKLNVTDGKLTIPKSDEQEFKTYDKVKVALEDKDNPNKSKVQEFVVEQASDTKAPAKPKVDTPRTNDTVVKVTVPTEDDAKKIEVVVKKDANSKTVTLEKDGNDWKLNGEVVQPNKDGKLEIKTADNAPLEKGQTVEVTVTDTTGNPSEKATFEVTDKPQLEQPKITTPKQNDRSIKGNAKDADKLVVKVTDRTGNEVVNKTIRVNEDGSFEVALDKPLKDGDTIKVVSKKDGYKDAEQTETVGLELDKLKEADKQVDEFIEKSKAEQPTKWNPDGEKPDKFDKNLKEKSDTAKGIIAQPTKATQAKVDDATEKLIDAMKKKQANDKVKIAKDLIEKQKPEDKEERKKLDEQIDKAIKEAQEEIDKVNPDKNEKDGLKKELQEKLDLIKAIKSGEDLQTDEKIQNKPQETKDKLQEKIDNAKETLKKEENTKYSEKTKELKELVDELSKESIKVFTKNINSGYKVIKIQTSVGRVSVKVIINNKEVTTIKTNTFGYYTLKLEKSLIEGQLVKLEATKDGYSKGTFKNIVE